MTRAECPAMAGYLRYCHFLLEEHVAELFQALYGGNLCAATLAGVAGEEGWILPPELVT